MPHLRIVDDHALEAQRVKDVRHQVRGQTGVRAVEHHAPGEIAPPDHRFHGHRPQGAQAQEEHQAGGALPPLFRVRLRQIQEHLCLLQTVLEHGGQATVQALIDGGFDAGCMQLQLNVLDPQILLDARDHPGRYPSLLVRVSGYSAYFDDLSPAMKQEIIDRTMYGRDRCSVPVS